MRNLLILFNEATAICTAEQFVAYISVHRKIHSWSVPFRGAYFIKTGARAQDIFEDIKKVVGGKGVFITVLSKPHSGGRMAPGFWDWFNSEEANAELIAAIADGQKG